MARNLFTGLSKLLRSNVLRNERHLSTCSIRQYSAAQAKPKEDVVEEKRKFDPKRHPDYFQVHKLFTIKDLFDARVHYGHKEGTLNDKMKCFIYGSRLGHLIFDLNQTAELLREALNFAAHIAYLDGIILFISRNPQTSLLVEKTAIECGEFAHTREFSLATFPNSYTAFKGVTRLPELCIFLNTLNPVMDQHIAVLHAAKMAIPTIGVVDTNCDPNLITYPVPGNDDTPSAVELYCKLFKQAILLGKEARKRNNEQA